MPKTPSSKKPNDLALVRKSLAGFQRSHPNAGIDIQRQNSVSIRVRIVEPTFESLSLGQRDDLIWNYLESLPDSVQTQITMLLLLAPNEQESSLANQEFENPIPSRL